MEICYDHISNLRSLSAGFFKILLNKAPYPKKPEAAIEEAVRRDPHVSSH
jgi:hypothetical protein